MLKICKIITIITKNNKERCKMSIKFKNNNQKGKISIKIILKSQKMGNISYKKILKIIIIIMKSKQNYQLILKFIANHNKII